MSEKKARLFHVKWDNAKIPNLSFEARFGTREAEGVVFGTGLVALSIGAMFESMSELEANLKAYGHAHIVYQDEKEQSA